LSAVTTDSGTNSDIQSIRTELERARDEDVVKNVIGRYTEIIKSNNDLNNKKAKLVTWATYSLVTAIVFIGIATGMTLSLFSSKPVGPTLTILDGASIQGHSAYEPNPIIAIKGDTIAVENKDSYIHTVTSGKGPSDLGRLFDTDIIKPGESAEVVVANLSPGEYPFFCTVHPYMKGMLRVIVLNNSLVTDSQRSSENQLINR
jgi:plastocyanin